MCTSRAGERAAAREIVARMTFDHGVLVAGRLFPEGVMVGVDAGPRWALGHGTSSLWRDAHVSLEAHAEVNPAFARGGPVLEIAPIAVWDLTLRAQGTGWFGTTGSIVPAGDPGATFERGQDARAGVGTRLDVDTRLKGRAGPVIAVVEGQVRRHHARLLDGDLAWYWDPTELVTIPADGTTWQGDAVLLAEAGPLRAGLMGTWTACPATDDEAVRLGPLLTWKPGEHGPTLYAGAQAWLESRFAPTFPPYTFLALEWRAAGGETR
jgi:hypothetical protein